MRGSCELTNLPWRGRGKTHFIILATESRPRLTISFASPNEEGAGKDRVRAAPEVSCALMHNKKCAHEHTGEAEAVRPSLRNGSTTYTRSPWRPGFLVTIPGVMRKHHRPLDAYPGASGPHDFIVRKSRDVLAQLSSIAARTAFPDVRDTPLLLARDGCIEPVI